MEIVDFTEQFAQQEKLDLDIAIKHNVSYDSTRNRRILALLVEIGELANETRCFKYWSNKKASEKAIILEEYADGMHFYLSLGVDLNVKNKCFEVENDGLDVVETFHQIYASISTLKVDYNETNYHQSFVLFLSLLPKLGFSIKEAKKAYVGKLEINYQRQDNNY